MQYKDGVYDISNDEYHSSSAYSRSQLMLFDKSPYHFWYEHIAKLGSRRETTESMIIGQAFHTLLLEPNLFDKEYAIKPRIDRRTSLGKEQWILFEDESRGKTILSIEQYEKASKMADLVSKHEIVTTLLDESVFEKSIFWTDKETGLQFKVRPDIWSEKMIVDVKTTKDASLHSFTRSALNYGYYLQAGMLYEACKEIGKKIDMFVHLAIEKEEPYVPSVFIMKDESLDFGIEQFQFYKKRLKECLDKNEWSAYKVQELSVPKYAIIEDE